MSSPAPGPRPPTPPCPPIPLPPHLGDQALALRILQEEARGRPLPWRAATWPPSRGAPTGSRSPWAPGSEGAVPPCWAHGVRKLLP